MCEIKCQTQLQYCGDLYFVGAFVHVVNRKIVPPIGKLMQFKPFELLLKGFALSNNA